MQISNSKAYWIQLCSCPTFQPCRVKCAQKVKQCEILHFLNNKKKMLALFYSFVTIPSLHVRRRTNWTKNFKMCVFFLFKKKKRKRSCTIQYTKKKIIRGWQNFAKKRKFAKVKSTKKKENLLIPWMYFFELKKHSGRSDWTWTAPLLTGATRSFQISSGWATRTGIKCTC